jgi:type VI secretion system protein ImpK
MAEFDPFSDFETDRTIIKPSAGRGARTATTAAPETRNADVAPLPEMHDAAGQSPLLQIAAPLLTAATRIRSTPDHANVEGLRSALAEAIRKVERDARARGLPNDQIVAARYILCTYVDECASSTPWGGAGAWAAQSLLVQFHNEAWGGEKVFALLAKLSEDVGRNRSLLELIYCVISLGFEGRYRVAHNGRALLEDLREKLALMLRQHSGTPLAELSPKWAGAAGAGQRLRDGIPVWVVATAAALLLALVFLALRLAMSSRTDSVFAQLQSLNVKAAPATAPPPPPVAVAPRLSGFLKPEIDAQLVEVRDLADRSIVIIKGDGFFEPGSAEVQARFLPLLNRIAEEMERIDGQVVVTGHTDNQPIRSMRFPSNWHLSEERAKSVKEKLAVKIKPQRLRSEGMADTQPVADNATPAGRSRNRRVEITLRLSQGT